jgi:tight adherence protein B
VDLPLDSATWLAALSAIAVALAFGAGALALAGNPDRRRYRRRLGEIGGRATGAPATAGSEPALSRRGSATPKIDRVAGRWLPRRDALKARLARTGRQISIGQYAIAILAISVLATLCLGALAPIGLVPCVLIGLLMGIGLPHLVLGRMGKRRVAAFIALFPEAIDLMVRALRSGLPISEAIIGAGHEIADPVGSELRLVEGGMRLGRDLESLLWDAAGRIDTPEFRFFIIALSVQRETGGNLAETLANLSEVLRRRRQMRAKVRAMASETRATTAILGGLPVLVILLLMVTSPDYLRPMISDLRGYFLDALALGMLFTGVLLMNKMAKFEI